MKLSKVLLSLVLYMLLLSIIYIIYIKFSKVDVVFYTSLHAVAVSTILLALIVFYFPFFSILSDLEKMQQVLICALIGYAFAISIPTVIDRSLSFYILEKIQQHGGGIKFDAFESIFTKEYSKEHHLVDVRLTEQSQSGTIVIENGCVKLTVKGNELATFSRFFRKNLLPKERLLMGQYTDVLTDPFRMSKVETNYLCK